MSEHFRDLLVCKDTNTIKLLQVSEGVADRYKSQSSRCSEAFLLTALNICNQADIQYKASKNQRLHIELTLMKLAKIKSALSLGHLAEELKKKD